MYQSYYPYFNPYQPQQPQSEPQSPPQTSASPGGTAAVPASTASPPRSAEQASNHSPHSPIAQNLSSHSKIVSEFFVNLQKKKKKKID
jgi:hypothetical protein